MRRRWLASAAILGLALAVPAAGQSTGRTTYLDKAINGKHMSETTARAAAQLAEFEQKKEPLCLQAAADLLQGIDLAKETDAMKRLALRRETLETWLALLALIDQNLDPNFNPQDLPSTGVDPPRVGNVSYPPGVDPSVIADPQARARYAEEQKQNTRKTENYRIQTWLQRFNESLSPKAERFVRMSYTTVPGDQREVNETVKKLIKNPQRASALVRAAAPKQ